MKNWNIAVIYTAFFALIGVAVWVTGSALPLWALLLTPSYSYNDDDDDDKHHPRFIDESRTTVPDDNY